MCDESYTALAGFYDGLMGDIDYGAWAEYVHSLLQKAGRPVRRIGEAACGTGNLTLRLKKMGYDILASDASGQMLERAAQKAREAGQQIVFSCQDMRRLQFPKVDAVVCACDGVNYLAPGELFSFFEAAGKCIRPGGALLFDMSSRYKLEQILAEQLFFEDGEELTYFWRNAQNRDKQCVEMELTFFCKDAQGSYVRTDEAQRQYWHEVGAVLRDLQKAGFEAKAYAFGTEQPPDERCQRIQFWAVKKQEV